MNQRFLRQRLKRTSGPKGRQVKAAKRKKNPIEGSRSDTKNDQTTPAAAKT